MKERSSLCCVVEKLEEQVNTTKNLVATRYNLREVNSQDRYFCCYFGFDAGGDGEKDLVMICCPRVVGTKQKTTQVLPPSMSTWAIHCLERAPQLSVTFF
jgi:hypothetical protein